MSSGTFSSANRPAAIRVRSDEYDEMPTYSALPCCTIDASAPTVSSIGVSGSTRCE